MERPNYAKLYKAPEQYKAPEEDKLRQNTEHPNFNSLQYRTKPINRTPKILKYFDCFSINENGMIILGCNELTGRVWDGYIWGFEDINSFGIESKGSFRIHLDSNVTNLAFIEANIFVTTQANGGVQIWSTKSALHLEGPYCLFLIGEQFEHNGIVLAMDTLDQNSLLVTGCSQGLLKIWEIGKADLTSIHAMHNAHSDSITSISSNSNSKTIFSTCSLDRSALIWDYRQQRPATSLYENHDFDLTAIHWCGYDQTDNDMIYLGDASGAVHMLDPKVPNKIVESIQIHTRPISKLRFFGSKMAVVGETNLLRIYENRKVTSNKYPKFECIYTDSTAQNFIRDALWNPIVFDELLSVGWDSKLHKHVS